jgi:hypothetical protein
MYFTQERKFVLVFCSGKLYSNTINCRKVGGFVLYFTWLKNCFINLIDIILAEEMMKKIDKFLIGIVTGIILLVVVAFIFALNKPKQTYQSDDNPKGVAFNYLFALQQGDYERAYGYILPSISGYPRTLNIFIDDIKDNSWRFNGLNSSSTTLEVESTDITGQRADVEIRETRFYEGDLFSSGQYTSTFQMELRQDKNGDWKIVESDDYWIWCWSDLDRCK